MDTASQGSPPPPQQQQQPACGSGTRAAEYNLPLHIGALFIILAVSASACAFPLLALKAAPKLRIPPGFLFFVRHFGTGVLIATAFVHLFPTAFVSLTDPCLPSFWNEDYPAMAGAIALAAVFAITVVEMVFNPGRSICADGSIANGRDSQGLVAAVVGEKDGNSKERPRPVLLQDVPGGNQGGDAADDLGLVRSTSLYGGSRSGRFYKKKGPHPDIIQRTGSIQADPEAAAAPPPPPPDAAAARASTPSPDQQQSSDTDDDGHQLAPLVDETKEQQEQEEELRRKKLTMQCVLLETGILFHSVFIGMSLAVSVGNDQVILLIAIAFHQTFEGLALGSRIAAVGWKPGALQPWIMAMAYGCTTPLGQAIGIGTHNLYDPDSETGLLVVGIMNAISSGLLTFTSLVDLLSEDFLSDDSWRNLRGTRRVVAFALVFAGAFVMSLVGAWA